MAPDKKLNDTPLPVRVVVALECLGVTTVAHLRALDLSTLPASLGRTSLRRLEALRAGRGRGRPRGSGTVDAVRVEVRVPRALLDAATAAAHAAGVSVSEWWRQAAEARLKT